MADLGDFIDIAADIAELFFDARSEMRKKAKPSADNAVVRPTVRPTAEPEARNEASASDIRFHGSPETDESSNAYSDARQPEPLRPSEIVNSTESEYCETCIGEKDFPRPAVRLSSRNLREAFILSELIAPPLSRRGRRLL